MHKQVCNAVPAEHGEYLTVLAVSGDQVAQARGGADSQPVGCLSNCFWVQRLSVALNKGSSCLSQNLRAACKQIGQPILDSKDNTLLIYITASFL